MKFILEIKDLKGMKIGFLRIVLNGIQINQVRSTAQSIPTPSTSSQSEARMSEPSTNEQPALSSYNPDPPPLSPTDHPSQNPLSGPSSGPSSGPPGPSGPTNPGPRPSRSDAVIRMKVDDMSDREVNFLLKRRGNKIIPGDIAQARDTNQSDFQY